MNNRKKGNNQGSPGTIFVILAVLVVISIVRSGGKLTNALPMILIAVVALAALFVLVAFSDRLRDMITGITVTLGGSADSSADKSSKDIMQDLDKTGL